jgi:hypothetical protein
LLRNKVALQAMNLQRRIWQNRNLMVDAESSGHK